MPQPVRQCRRAVFGRALCAALLAGVAACGEGRGSPVTPPDTAAPSNARAELTAGVTVSGTVTVSGRTGKYLIRAPVGQWVRLFLQARSGKAADTLVAAVKDSTGKVCCWSVASAGSDTSLTAQGSDFFQVGAGDPMYVDVTGLRPDDSGAFSLLLYAQDTKPEKLGQRITIGDTLSGESIDLPGDVDHFYFTAQAGDELILFAQAQSALQLLATLSDSATATELTSVTSTGQDTSLLGQPTQRRAISKTGTYRVQIVGLNSTRGPYRFFVARVNRAPEHAPRILAPGDTSGYESIDYPGDIDEFSFAGVAGTEMNVLFQVVSGLTGTMHLELLQDGKSLASGSVEGPTASLEAAATGTVTLPTTGQYTVRVFGEIVRPQAAAIGRYRFELYRIDRRPEHAAVLVPIGTTVDTEALEKPGDIDEFRIPAAPGKSFVVALHEPGDSTPVCLHVLQADTLVAWPAGALSWGCYPWTMQGYTNMIAAPDTGSYTLRVFAPDNYYGRYSFEIYALSKAPETLPATFAPGRPVSGERMDRAMDVDTFTFAGTAGQYVNVFLRRDAGYTGQLHLLLQSAAMPINEGWWGYDMSQVSGGSATLDSANAGRLKLPVTGLYKIVVADYSASEGSTPPGTGPYSFLVFPIDSRPEGRSASFAIGDTVREAIYPSGDIDEYTFSGTAGDHLSLNIGGDVGLFQAGLAWLDPTIYDPTGKLVLRAFKTPVSWDIDLQTTGTYTIRVWVPDGNSWQVFAPVAMGSYWMALTRRP